MSVNNERTLSRDVKGTVIPTGEPVDLPTDTKVTITHRLGGNFTVVCDFGMFRINGADADALGEEIPEETAKQEENVEAAAKHDGPPETEKLWDALKTVYDPEIPVNIVDLGLIYSLETKEAEGKHIIQVSLTLTAPGCGMGPAIADDAKQRLVTVHGVDEANVEIVWDPPWHQDMISEEGKMQLGLVWNKIF